MMMTPRAPYKVYEGEELKGTYPTALKHGGRNSNSKAQAADSEPQRHFIIKDVLERVVI